MVFHKHVEQYFINLLLYHKIKFTKDCKLSTSDFSILWFVELKYVNSKSSVWENQAHKTVWRTENGWWDTWKSEGWRNNFFFFKTIVMLTEKICKNINIRIYTKPVLYYKRTQYAIKQKKSQGF